MIATQITVEGEKLQRLIGRFDARHLVDTRALPGLVRLAEQGDFADGPVLSYLEETLGDYDFSNCGFLVLGCTHFNYFKDSLRAFLPEYVRFFDGNAGTAKQLMRKVGRDPEEQADRHIPVEDTVMQQEILKDILHRTTFYASGELLCGEAWEERGRILLSRLIRMREIR